MPGAAQAGLSVRGSRPLAGERPRVRGGLRTEPHTAAAASIAGPPGVGSGVSKAAADTGSVCRLALGGLGLDRDRGQGSHRCLWHTCQRTSRHRRRRRSARSAASRPCSQIATQRGAGPRGGWTTGTSVPVRRLGLYSTWPRQRGLAPVSGDHREADFKHGASFLYVVATCVLAMQDLLRENWKGDTLQPDPASSALEKILFALVKFGDGPTPPSRSDQGAIPAVPRPRRPLPATPSAKS